MTDWTWLWDRDLDLGYGASKININILTNFCFYCTLVKKSKRLKEPKLLKYLILKCKFGSQSVNCKKYYIENINTSNKQNYMLFLSYRQDR